MKAFVCCLLLAASQEGGKPPVPSDKEFRACVAEIRTLLKADYSDERGAGRRLLARRLLSVSQTSEKAPMRYALLVEAAEAASSGGDFELSMTAIRQVEDEFAVEPGSPLTGGAFSVYHPMRKDLLKRTSRRIREAESARSFVSASLCLAEIYCGLDSFDDALEVSRLAKAVAAVSRDAAVQASAQKSLLRFEELKRQHDRIVKVHLEALRDPSNERANTAWGEFLVFIKGDHERGFAFLARGDSGPLRDVAAMETGSAGVSALSDAWFSIASKTKGAHQSRYLERARFWSGQALSQSTGIDRLRMEERLGAIDRMLGISDLLEPVDPSKDYWASGSGTDGYAERDGKAVRVAGGAYRTGFLIFAQTPPAEYEFSVTATHMGGEYRPLLIGFRMGAHRCLAALGQGSEPGPGMLNVDGRPLDLRGEARESSIIPSGSSAVYTVSIRSTGIILSINGCKVLDWVGDASRLSTPAWAPQSSLYVGAPNCRYKIEGATIRPFMGYGPPSK